MEVEVTFLARRGNAVLRQSRRVDARRIRFGRGTGNEIQLNDIRVDLTAAAMFPRDGVLTIQALGPSPILVNGLSVPRDHAVGPGDEISIGPYSIAIREPEAGIDAALTIELAQPLGDTLARLSSQARLRLWQSAYSKRLASWWGFLVVAVIGLIGPIVGYALAPPRVIGANRIEAASVRSIASLWEPGAMANAHRFFGADCATCHRSAFARVPDAACISCHGNTRVHFAAATLAGGTPVGTAQCAACHEEHRGKTGIVISDDRLCVQCHATLAERRPELKVHDVVDIRDHPQFRVTVVADAGTASFRRVALGGAPVPENLPGLKFSHVAHLVPDGFPALGYKPMVCADCHTPEPSRQGFQPITYAAKCARCHQLSFERQALPWPAGRVPHGDDRGIAAAVWNFYAGKALQGTVGKAPPAPAVLRLAPGDKAAAAASTDALSWVREKTEAALRTVIFEAKRGCAYCHFGTGADGKFDLSGVLPVGTTAPGPAPSRLVAPVLLQNRFLPFARFDHASHAAMKCEQCHAARHSETIRSVMIPGVENCLACHGSQQTALRAESTCITCHRFHHTESGAIGTASTAPQATQKTE